MSQPQQQQPGSAKKQCSITSFFGSPPGSKSESKVEKAGMVSPPSSNSSVSSPPANDNNKSPAATTPAAKPKLASIFSTPKAVAKDSPKTDKDTPKLASIFTKPNSGTPKTATPKSNTATPKSNSTTPKAEKTPTSDSINSTIDAVIKAATPTSDVLYTPKTSKSSTPKVSKESTPKTPKEPKPAKLKENGVKNGNKEKTPKISKKDKEEKKKTPKISKKDKEDKENTPKISKKDKDSSPGKMDSIPSNLILPTQKVKMIMKSCPDVEYVPQESLILITKATELFIQYLANEAQKSTTSDKLDYKSLSTLVHDADELEFLRETIPKKITWEEAQRRIALAEKQELDLL